MNKFNTLTPDANEMNFPSKSIGHIEAALKNISDLVHENEIHKEYSNALQNRRTGDVKMKLKMKILMNLSIPFFTTYFILLGLQRVGPIAMNMMLTGERRAHLVLNCARCPTKKLLEFVCEKVIDMLKTTERPFANFDERKEHLELYKESQNAKQETSNKKGVHFQVKEDPEAKNRFLGSDPFRTWLGPLMLDGCDCCCDDTFELSAINQKIHLLEKLYLIFRSKGIQHMLSHVTGQIDIRTDNKKR